MTLMEATPQVKKQVITAKDVEHHEAIAGVAYEISNGKWLEEPSMASFEHGGISGNIYTALRNYLKDHPIGKARPDGVTYVLNGTPDDINVMRLPDVSFLSNSKLDRIEPQGFVYAAPDIAVEVISKSEKRGEIYDKMNDYFEYGTEQVWLVYPEKQWVVVHFPDGTTDTYHQDDTLTCTALLPDFQLPLLDIFDLT